MASTVRIGEDDKDRLRRLQEAIEDLTGQRPTQQELLGRGLAYLEDHRDEFLAAAAWTPLDADEIEAMKQRLVTASGQAEPYDIDEVVYGEAQVRGQSAPGPEPDEASP